MEVLKIKNFEKYQHYHTRKITSWIKLYFSILDDYYFSKLSYEQKYLYVGLLLLAGKTQNQIPFDLEYISQQLGKNDNLKEHIDKLIELGFLSIDKVKTKYRQSIDKVYTKSIQSIDKDKNKIRKDKIREDNNNIYSQTPNGVCQADKPLDATLLNHKLKSYEKTKDTIPFKEWMKEIIDFLNKKTGKHFTYHSQAIERFMKARYQEGYSVLDGKLVILHKCETWGRDDKMREYIRPSTLFRATHFPEYLAEARKWYIDKLEKEGNYEKVDELKKIWFLKEEK
ncbi:MAG: conserved phage C-terminal domain-containing protein [Elusimicrobiota bacterium]|nr:conserved phage C-terminal domain-containing protein [Endomicrobiia bacterium]MDW8166647.1 conserved phage C-terminal domain-containing protein [Elusimicrobiota bacterium]